MDNYVTANTIKQLRESKGLTQNELAEILNVSDKTVSKWETAKGLPDITLIEPLAKALNVSVLELMSGNTVTNKNISANILRSKFYVCPVCGNTIRTIGDTVISCCGITLPQLIAEEPDSNHTLNFEKVEDEIFVTIEHEMTKQHYISFFVYLTLDKVKFIKLYPEGNAETRFKLQGSGFFYYYCNRHGLFKVKI